MCRPGESPPGMRREESQCWHVQDFGLKENGHVFSYSKWLDEKVKTTFLQNWQGWLGILQAIQAYTTVLSSPES